MASEILDYQAENSVTTDPSLGYGEIEIPPITPEPPLPQDPTQNIDFPDSSESPFSDPTLDYSHGIDFNDPESKVDYSNPEGAKVAALPIKIILAALAKAAAAIAALTAIVVAAITIHEKLFSDQSVYRDLPSDLRRSIQTQANVIDRSNRSLRVDLQRYHDIPIWDVTRALEKLNLARSIISQSNEQAKRYEDLANDLESGLGTLIAEGSPTVDAVKSNIADLRELARKLKINPLSLSSSQNIQNAQSPDLNTQEGVVAFIGEKVLEGGQINDIYSQLENNSSYFQGLPDNEKIALLADTGEALSTQLDSVAQESTSGDLVPTA